MGISIKNLERKAKSAADGLRDATESIINNTVADVDNILANIGDCAEAMGNIGVRITQRAIQYHTSVSRIMRRAEVYPSEIISSVMSKVLKGCEDHDPNAIIYHLENPGPSVWEDKSRIMTPIDPETFSLPSDRIPYIFIHGIENQGETDAFEFYKKFEKAAWMFNHSNQNVDYSSCVDIYIVSYDSKISNEEEKIIIEAFESVGVTIDGPAPHLFAAAMWKEWLRRAEITSTVIQPFLNKMKYLPYEKKGFALSHSLGTEVLSHAAHNLIKSDPDEEPALQSWWSFAGAVPVDAFSSTGQYPLAPRIARDNIRESPGTSIWYSAIDSYLSFLYFLSNDHPAMGQCGAHVNEGEIKNYINHDVTRCVGVAHETKYYFPLLGPTMRRILHTQIMSEDPNAGCAVQDVFESNSKGTIPSPHSCSPSKGSKRKSDEEYTNP